MFNVLITGKLTKMPKLALGKNGAPYCTAALRVPVQGNREDEPDHLFASAIAFGADAEKLGRLATGDIVSLSGNARLSHWEKDGRTQTGVNVTVNGVLTAYQIRQKRGEALEPPADRPISHLSVPRINRQPQPAIFSGADDFDDEPAF